MELLKTFESRVVGRTSDWGGFVGSIVLLYGVVSAGAAWVAKQLTRFGEVGWPEAVFIGLGASAVLTLVIGAFLVMWRVFRPIAVQPAPKQSESLQIPRLPEDEIARREAVDALMETVHYLREKEREQSIALKSNDEAWNAAVEMIKGERVERIASIDSLAKDIFERIGAISAIEHFEEALRALNSRLDSLEDGALRNHRRFNAMWHRELLAERDGAIQHWVKVLDEYPGGSIATWEDWQQGFDNFRSHLSSWQELAQRYETIKVGALFDQPAALFKSSNWTRDFSEFPSPDAVHDFKSFRIILRNYLTATPAVKREIDNVIFNAA